MESIHCRALVALALLIPAAAAGGQPAAYATRSNPLPELTLRVRSFQDKQGVFDFRADGRPAGWLARRVALQPSCWSPNGQTIALTRTNGELALLDLRTHQTRTLPVTNTWSCSSWSPDGRLLLALSPPASCLPTQAAQPRNGCTGAARRLTVIPLSGGRPITLSFGASGGIRSPTWSPDSAALAFVRLSRFVPSAAGTANTGRPQLLTIRTRRTDALGPVGLRASTLSWAPNSTTLLVQRGTSGYPTAAGSLTSFNIRNGAITRIGAGHDPAWSTSSLLAWVCGRAICLRKPGSHLTTRIVAPTLWRPQKSQNGGYTGLAWSPDGARLAFESARTAESSRIFLVDRNGRNVRHLHPNDRNQQQAQPTWSPDGRFIAYWAGLFRNHSAVYIKQLGRPKTVLVPAFDATHYDFEDGFVWRPLAP